MIKRKYKNQNFLIVGGTGFIGANIAIKLVEFGANVSVLHREKSNFFRLQGIKNKINFYEVDFMNFDDISTTIKDVNPSHVLNFALFASNSDISTNDKFSNQLKESSLLLSNLLLALTAIKSNLVSFVHGCSSFVYSWDENNFTLSEKTPLRPIVPRGIIKLNERNLCLYYADVFDLPIRIARIFRAYGPWDHDYKLIVKVLKNIQEGKTTSIGQDDYKRDYIYVEDLVDGVLNLTNKNLASGLEVNFGSGKQYSAKEIIIKMEKIMNREIDKVYDYKVNQFDRGDYLADISFAKKLLDWSPKYSIEEGLKKTIDWYKQCQNWK